MAFKDLKQGVEELFAEAQGLRLKDEFFAGATVRDPESRREQNRRAYSVWRSKQPKAKLKALRRDEYVRNRERRRATSKAWYDAHRRKK